MESRSLRVLLVAEDRQLLRRLSKFLEILDYQVHQVADWRQSPRALATARADFLILDSAGSWEAATEICHQAGQQATPIYTMLLLESPSQDDIQRGLAAGADDFVAKPVVYGELLARLRAGARALEFERRCGRQRGVDPVTRLPSEAAFRARLTRALAVDQACHRAVACAVLDLDFFGHVNALFGWECGNEVLRAVAARMGEIAEKAPFLASFGGGKFAAILPGVPDSQAVAWADEVRLALSETEFPCKEQSLRLTVSAGVVAVDPGEVRPVDELLQEAGEALLAAKRSGRDCVLRFAEHQEGAADGVDFAEPGRLFERTVARDVMTPCPSTLQASDAIDYAVDVLRRTRIGALPVVADDGSLVGLLVEADLTCELGLDATPLQVGDLMCTDVATCAEEEPFDALRDFFVRDARSHLVVTAGRRPIGLLSPDHLAALGVRLRSDTFVERLPYSPGSDFLTVPDLNEPTDPGTECSRPERL